jgi:hypothetical protein
MNSSKRKIREYVCMYKIYSAEIQFCIPGHAYSLTSYKINERSITLHKSELIYRRITLLTWKNYRSLPIYYDSKTTLSICFTAWN